MTEVVGVSSNWGGGERKGDVAGGGGGERQEKILRIGFLRGSAREKCGGENCKECHEIKEETG